MKSYWESRGGKPVADVPQSVEQVGTKVGKGECKELTKFDFLLSQQSLVDCVQICSKQTILSRRKTREKNSVSQWLCSGEEKMSFPEVLWQAQAQHLCFCGLFPDRFTRRNSGT